MSQRDICPVCEGYGGLEQFESIDFQGVEVVCPTCRGSGRVSYSLSIKGKGGDGIHRAVVRKVKRLILLNWRGGKHG